MHPIPGVFEKKAAQSAWDYFRNWYHRNRDLKKQVSLLQAQLVEERSGNLAFEKMMSELVCRTEDDSIYWKKDGSGGPYCPLCLHSDKKLIPLSHGNRDRSFYCRLHEHTFAMEGLRKR